MVVTDVAVAKWVRVDVKKIEPVVNLSIVENLSQYHACNCVLAPQQKIVFEILLYSSQITTLITLHSVSKFLCFIVRIIAFTVLFYKAMKSTTPSITETQLESVFEYRCKMDGAQWLSFPPVVAGGEKALSLHYIKNDQLLQYVY